MLADAGPTRSVTALSEEGGQELGLHRARLRDRVLQTHVVLTVSEFAKSMYVRHGYPTDRLRVEPLPATVSDGVRWRLREFWAYPV